MPTQHDLRRRHLVGGCRACDGFHPEEVVFSLAQRPPGLGDDVVFGLECFQLLLLEDGVQFDLVHGRHDVCLRDEAGEVGDEKVADTDRCGPTVRVERFEGAPGVDVEVVVGHGPVNQVQVEVVEAQGLETAAEGALNVAAFMVIVSELRGDEDLLPGDPRRVKGCADFSFVVVSGGCVDVPVTDREGVFDDALRVGRVNEEHSETELGDSGAGIEGNGGDVSSHDSSLDPNLVTRQFGACGQPVPDASTARVLQRSRNLPVGAAPIGVHQ